MGQYRIENAFFAQRKGIMRFCISGRYETEPQGPYKVEVFAGQEKLSQVKIAFDACMNGFRKKKQNESFRISGECPTKMLRHGLRMLFIAGELQDECLFPHYKIRRMTKKCPICYAVDRCEAEEGWIFIGGWAYSLFGESIEYQLGNRRGKKLDYSVKRTKRQDIQRLFQADNECEAGFQIKLHDFSGNACKLVIKSKTADIKVLINKKKLRKRHKRQDSLYMSGTEILKSLTMKQCLSDLECLCEYGRKELVLRWKKRYLRENGMYEYWRVKHQLSKEILEQQKKEKFAYEPVISIVVPVYCTPKDFLCQMVESVQKQTYGNWELCIADGSGKDDAVENIMKGYLKDKRIRYKRLERNEGIAGNTNQAMKMASGEFVGLLDHDDMLAENTLFEVVTLLNKKPDADVIYSDEDKVSADSSKYTDPYFKSDFNLDLLRSNNYICHFFVVRKSLADSVGGFDKNLDGAQDHDFIFKCTEKAREILHIPKILYHWRIHNNSTAGAAENKAYCEAAGKKAVEAHLKRMGIEAAVSSLSYGGFYRVDYACLTEPMVSILIPNRNEKESLEKCINSILKKTTYRNFEIIVIENNSTEKEIFDYYSKIENIPEVRVIFWKDKFNYSAINNFGARSAKGEYLVLLNNDTEIIEPEWLSCMLADCMRPEVGIVGAMLYYPDDTIQHAGVVLGIGDVAGHIYKYFPRDHLGNFMKTHLQQNFSAVTAACLMVKKSVFDEVKGLEERLEVAFNDVDFCLKVREKGYLIVFEPKAELYHYESKSRGAENTPEKINRFHKEVAYMVDTWESVLDAGDPYYNKNLTLKKEDGSLSDEDYDDN